MSRHTRKTKEEQAAETQEAASLGNSQVAVLLHGAGLIPSCEVCGNVAQGICLVCGHSTNNQQPAPAQD